MVKELRHVDVSTSPDLQSLAEEVASSGEGVVLRRDNKDLATVLPAESATARNRKKGDGLQAAFGAWKDMDTEEIKGWIYEGRKSSKPPVDL